MVTVEFLVAAQSADVEASLRDTREAGRRAVRDRTASGVRTGDLPADTDVEALARHYAAAFQGMSTQARDGTTSGELEALAELPMRAWPE